MAPAPSPAPIDPAFLERPFEVRGPEDLNALALDLFRLHAARNPVYRGFLEALRIDPATVTTVEAIPFLPISLFRSQRILLQGLEPRLSFTSSGTTGAVTSTHHVPWPDLYERSFLTSFAQRYGDPTDLRVLALLPAYLERPGSSLVHMARTLIEVSRDPLSGTYLYDRGRLAEVLRQGEAEGRRTLLLGVTFALLDLADEHPMPLRHTVVMETGGMKGRRPEMVRAELHDTLKRAFALEHVHSEYGMTELLSQAWSAGEGIYRCPPWMRVLARDPNDPLTRVANGRTGGLDVIDLCNVGSCPFISTQDLGKVYDDGSFEVLGRFDHSDLRGCNLLVEG